MSGTNAKRPTSVTIRPHPAGGPRAAGGKDGDEMGREHRERARRGRIAAALMALVLVVPGCTTGAPQVSPSTPVAASAQASAPPETSAPPAPPRPTRRPPPPPTASPAPPTARIGERTLVDGRQYLTVVRAEQWRGAVPTVNARYVAVHVRLEGVVDAPSNPNLFSVDTEGRRKNVASVGRRPRFAASGWLRADRTYEAWLTFSLPQECTCQLLYALPIGSGRRSEPVRIALDPIGEPTPEPPPEPRSRTRPVTTEVAGLEPDFFGPDVTVSSYRVTGSTPAEILDSIDANGPFIDWIGGRAVAVTSADPVYHVEVVATWSDCQVVTTGARAVTIDYAVLLPGWDPPRGVSRATVRWWTDELREIAIHERTHVEIYRQAEAELNEIVATASCADVWARTEATWDRVIRQQCGFDMREYGEELGLRLDECVSGA